jgi:ribosomal-protein-alanine N-acetyltransferase
MLRLNFSSFPVIETERLVLREHQMTDVNTLYQLRTDEKVMQFIDRERPGAIEMVEVMINKFNAGYPTGEPLTWAIALKENPSLMIGTIGYYRQDYGNFRAEIGYMLHPSYWRQGFVSEALAATLQFGFEEMKLHSIQANINPGNDASRQILLKHGFVKEAYFREDYYFNGKFLDSEIYSLLKNS